MGIKDAAFSVPLAKLDRLAPGIWSAAKTRDLELYDGVSDNRWNRPPAFPDASAGRAPTIDDYLVFGQMMLNKGKLGHERILSRPSVEAMTNE